MARFMVQYIYSLRSLYTALAPFHGAGSGATVQRQGSECRARAPRNQEGIGSRSDALCENVKTEI